MEFRPPPQGCSVSNSVVDRAIDHPALPPGSRPLRAAATGANRLRPWCSPRSDGGETPGCTARPPDTCNAIPTYPQITRRGDPSEQPLQHSCLLAAYGMSARSGAEARPGGFRGLFRRDHCKNPLRRDSSRHPTHLPLVDAVYSVSFCRQATARLLCGPGAGGAAQRRGSLGASERLGGRSESRSRSAPLFVDPPRCRRRHRVSRRRVNHPAEVRGGRLENVRAAAPSTNKYQSGALGGAIENGVRGRGENFFDPVSKILPELKSGAGAGARIRTPRSPAQHPTQLDQNPLEIGSREGNSRSAFGRSAQQFESGIIAIFPGARGVLVRRSIP